MGRVLFVPGNATTWREMYDISLDVTKYADVFYLLGDSSYDKKLIEMLSDSRVRVINEAEAHNYLANSNDNYGKVGFFLKNVLAAIKVNIFAQRVMSFIRSGYLNRFLVDKRVNHLNSQMLYFSHLLAENKIDTVVVSDDRSGSFTLPLLKVCKDKGIKSVIPPISLAAQAEDLVFTRRALMGHEHGGRNKIIDKYPLQFVYDKDSSRYVSFYRNDVLLSSIQADVIPLNPWVMGGGNSTVLLADGVEAYERYVRNGCHKDKILITGHRSHDVLYKNLLEKETIKRNVLKKYHLNEEKIVIVALPQLGEHNMLSWDDHWKEIRFLAEVYRDIRANIIVSLHPKMNRDHYRFLENEYGLVVSEEDLNQILPIADIFTATFSSTVQWSILCQIPTLIFDFYNLNFSIYDWMTGAVLTSRRSEYKDQLCKLLKNTTYYQELQKNAKIDAGRISPFDGKCANRIVESIVQN